MLCPLCNGIGPEPDNCSICGSKVTECGRTTDWTGPYEPYTPPSEGWQNGYFQGNDIELCCHIVYCESCSRISEVWVAQLPYSQ